MEATEWFNIGSDVLAGSPRNLFPTECHHTQSATTNTRLKCYKRHFNSPYFSDYRLHIASLRLKRFQLPQVSSSAPYPQKYVEPVVDFFRKVIAAAPGATYSPVSWSHTNQPGELLNLDLPGLPSSYEITRIHFEKDDVMHLLCLIIWVAPGTICWQGLEGVPRPGPNYEKAEDLKSTCGLQLVETWTHLQYAENPQFIVTTDEHQTRVLRQLRVTYFGTKIEWSQYGAESGIHSLRNLIHIMLHHVPGRGFGAYPWRKDLQGALNVEPHAGRSLGPSWRPQTFRDFDLFTLERSLCEMSLFLAWKESESERMGASLLGPGAIMAVTPWAFSSEESVWRSIFPNPPIPDNTRRMGPLSTFEVTEVVRHRVDAFSQVFFGRLGTANGDWSPPVCLKLFLDVMFPVDADENLSSYDKTTPPWRRLATLHYPEDLVRREEAAYNRLQDYQGGMIPHCYGFHRFAIEGQFTAYGALLEIIPGPMLAEIDPTQWSLDSQTAFAYNLRQCVRAVLYAGVEQGDFHEGQIILPQGPEYVEGHSIVLIDFAFTTHRLGDEQAPDVMATLPNQSCVDVGIMLLDCGFTAEAVGDLFWSESLHIHEM
uniref:Aminoglycoside phosphotransferase domain-containing protein n=1 Tax=Mycena chlorophos TaxID=658473 RepID=A0ABQ0L684_MYCCL|nr:predicted protein [Mycena chlorophos]